MIYDIYHDESKKEAFRHVFLFTPKDNRREVLKYLRTARQLSNFKGKRLSFKNLGSNTSFECAKAWISILMGALQQKEKSGLEPFYLGKTRWYSRSEKRRIPLYRQFLKHLSAKLQSSIKNINIEI
jgi:hypothetical protein